MNSALTLHLSQGLPGALLLEHLIPASAEPNRHKQFIHMNSSAQWIRSRQCLQLPFHTYSRQQKIVHVREILTTWNTMFSLGEWCSLCRWRRRQDVTHGSVRTSLLRILWTIACFINAHAYYTNLELGTWNNKIRLKHGPTHSGILDSHIQFHWGSIWKSSKLQQICAIVSTFGPVFTSVFWVQGGLMGASLTRKASKWKAYRGKW